MDFKGGDYNLFWHYRLDEALKKGEIAPFAIYDKEDYILKREIIKGEVNR